MRLKSQKILEIKLTASSKQDILEYLRKYLSQRPKSFPKLLLKPLLIVTPNPEQIVFARQNPRFDCLLNQADVALPDGVGIVWANRFLNQKTKIQRIPGIEFMQDLVKLAAEQGHQIGLIGGRGGLALEALECLQRKHPGLVGWAEDGPELEFESEGPNQQYNNITIKQCGKDNTEHYFLQVAEKILRTSTRLVFVGLGAPKQEFFCEKLASSIQHLADSKTQTLNAKSYPLSAVSPLVLMSVGGSFDMLAGRIKRAPLFLRQIGLEWLWRLVRQPWRLHRQIALVKFIFFVLLERLR